MHLNMAKVIGVEGRAKYAAAIAESQGNSTARYYGLDMWSPNINIFRDPRWGRGQETYGEDPYLTSRLGIGTTFLARLPILQRAEPIASVPALPVQSQAN